MLGPILVRPDEESIIDTAEEVRQATGAGEWLGDEWTPVPWDDDHWVRTTTNNGPWEIIEVEMDSDTYARMVYGDLSADNRKALTREWLDTSARQQWSRYRTKYPAAATWLPPLPTPDN